MKNFAFNFNQIERKLSCFQDIFKPKDICVFPSMVWQINYSSSIWKNIELGSASKGEPETTLSNCLLKRNNCLNVRVSLHQAYISLSKTTFFDRNDIE